MNNVKISVVTVCYNAVKELERTMLSVLNQTYDNVEYIVIDGGSTDGTVEIIKKYADRLAYWVSEPDKGIYDAMNKGIRIATGEWLLFLNAGDIFYSKDTLSSMIKHYDGKARILRGNIIRKYKRFNVKSTGVTKQDPDIMDMFNNTFHHQACLIQKTLFDEVGYYDTDYQLCADWKFFFDCVVKHKISSYYVDMPVAFFKMDGVSSMNTKKCIEEHRRYLIQLYGSDLFSYLQELSVYRKSYVSRLFYSIRNGVIDSLSPEAFSFFLNLKRICRSLLGLQVN